MMISFFKNLDTLTMDRMNTKSYYMHAVSTTAYYNSVRRQL